MSRKSFVNTPAARMLAGSAVVENKISEETKLKPWLLLSRKRIIQLKKLLKKI